MERIAYNDRGNDQEVLNGIIQKLPGEPLSKQSYKNVGSLNFNDPRKYRLLDIDQLDHKDYRDVYRDIIFLDISNNSISTLKLKGYHLLEVIKAENNSLTRVELNLPRLASLDLTDNMLTKIVELTSIPLLTDLKLCKNAIRKITFEELRAAKNTLTSLDLSQNRIEFSAAKEFFEIFEQLGKNMKKLISLNLSNNTFNHQHNKVYYREYAEFILRNFLGLKQLNGKLISLGEREGLNSIEVIKKKILDFEKLEGPIRLKPLDMVKDKNILPNTISLSYINKKMENYSLEGKLNKSTFKDFKILVDFYLSGAQGSTSSGDDDNDNMKLEDNETNDFETFLEYCNILTDSTPSIEKVLLDLVANFSIIKNGKFSNTAIRFIQQRMKPENIKDTEDIISRIIVDYICKVSDENLPSIMIKCLEPFLVEPKLVVCFKKLIFKLGQVIKVFNKFNFINTRNSEENRIKELYLCATSFISSSCVNNDYLGILVENSDLIIGFEFKIKNLLNESEDKIALDFKLMEILIKQLNIIRYMCMYNSNDSPKAITNMNKLVGSGLKDKIEQSINERLQAMSKKHDKKGVNIMKQLYLYKKQIMSNLFRCYGSLLYRLENLKMYVENRQSIPNKILNLLTQNEMNDPILISAACDFTSYFLQNKKMLINAEGIFDTTIKNLYNLRYVLPYLFQDRAEFKAACEEADKYGDNTLLRGKPIELFNMNSEIINTLIISIVRLIEFFGRKSKKDSKIKAACLAVCQDLNDQNRDYALCQCLAITNENVKYAIVKCLYSIDCGQLSIEEIGLIWKQAVNVNLMEGLMEKIITVIFLILNKCFLYYLTIGKYDVIEQNKDAFAIAYDLLLKNEERGAIHEIESNEKIELSIALKTMIFNCSCFDALKTLFLDVKNASKIYKTLYFEENFRDPGFSVPIEIEKSKSGCKIENLISCFKDEIYSLNPYTYVSLRIISHIANLLMGISYPLMETVEYETYEELIFYLRNQIIKEECETIYYESQTFKKFEEDRIINVKPAKFKVNMTIHDRKDEQLKFLKFFPVLIKYVGGQLIQRSISYFKKVFEDKFDKNIDNINYSTDKIEYTKKEEILSEDISSDTNIYETFVNYLREEEYCKNEIVPFTEYDYISNDKLIFIKYGIEGNTTRYKNEEIPDNPYIRGLFIAAFLRSIYAILDFAVEKSIKDEIIKILFTGDNIKQISKLADCTKFLENNIATKYLTIMRHLLLNANIFFQINESSPESINEYLTKIGIVAYVIKKTVKVIQKDIKLDTDDHKIFISEIGRCCWIIINQLQAIEFKSVEIRLQTTDSLIDEDIIQLLLQMIKDYMNREANSYKKKKNDSNSNEIQINPLVEDPVMNEMISTIALIIGEYMSKCKIHSYTILENLTRGYIFEKVKLRKTYLRQIIEYSKLSDLKMKISFYFKFQVHLVSRVFITKPEKETYVKLMIISDNYIDFLDIQDPLDEKSDSNINDFKLDEKMRIKIIEVQAIIHFDLENRLLLKINDNEFHNFFFLRINIVSIFIFILRSSNSRFKYFEKIPLFVNEEFLDNQNKDLRKEICKLRPEFKYLNEEGGGDTSDAEETPIQENSDDGEKKDNVIIFCITKNKFFFDFITDAFKKPDIIEDGKIVVIKNRKLMIYEEIVENWNYINYERIFNTALMKPMIKGIFLYNFMDCYKLLNEVNLENGLADYVASGVDNITLSFDNGYNMNFAMLDDISCIKFKKAIFPLLKTNDFDVKDDYYDEIN